MGRIKSHLMLYAVICINVKLETKTKKNDRDIVAEALTVGTRLYSRKPGKRGKSKGRPTKMNVLFVERKDIRKRIVLNYKRMIRARLFLIHVLLSTMLRGQISIWSA